MVSPRLAPLALLLPCALCCAAPDPDSTLDVVYDPCSGVVVSSPNATSAEQSSIDAALELWVEAGGFALTREPVADWPRLEIRFEEAPGAQHGVYDDERGLVFINRRLERSRERAITIAHELGHAFGLWHVHGTRSLMNENNLSIEPTSADVASVRSAWLSCQGPSSEG